RSVVSQPATGPSDGSTFFTSVLYDRFKTFCGACHVGQNSGGFEVTSSTFAARVTSEVVDRITLDNGDSSRGPSYMPPANSGGKPWSARLASADDPVVELVTLLRLWIQQGSPAVQFQLPAAAPRAPATGTGGQSTAVADGGAPDGLVDATGDAAS